MQQPFEPTVNGNGTHTRSSAQHSANELEQSDPPKPRTVLVTGALGNLGRMTLDALLGEGHRVRALDLPTGANRRAGRRLPDGVDLRFGSVTDPRSVAAAVRGVDALAHFAGLLPPATERTPDLAHAVNVEGTRNLVAAAETEKGAVRFIEASSYTLYGPDARRHGIVRSDAPVVATDVYSQTKVAAEEIVKSSSLDWVIFRIAAAHAVSASCTTSITAPRTSNATSLCGYRR